MSKASILILSFLFLLFTSASFAQGKKKKKQKEQQPSAQPNSVNPSYQEITYAPKSTKTKSKGITYGGEKKYYARKAQVEKENRKAEKEMMKPQYSDPSYFGHKHPPKRHKRGKLKYCKECGIKH